MDIEFDKITVKELIKLLSEKCEPEAVVLDESGYPLKIIQINKKYVAFGKYEG